MTDRSSKTRTAAGKRTANPAPPQQADRLKTLLLRFLKALPPAGAEVCRPAPAQGGTANTGTSATSIELAMPTGHLHVEARIVALAAREGTVTSQCATTMVERVLHSRSKTVWSSAKNPGNRTCASMSFGQSSRMSVTECGPSSEGTSRSTRRCQP